MYLVKVTEIHKTFITFFLRTCNYNFQYISRANSQEFILCGFHYHFKLGLYFFSCEITFIFSSIKKNVTINLTSRLIFNHSVAGNVKSLNYSYRLLPLCISGLIFFTFFNLFRNLLAFYHLEKNVYNSTCSFTVLLVVLPIRIFSSRKCLFAKKDKLLHYVETYMCLWIGSMRNFQRLAINLGRFILDVGQCSKYASLYWEAFKSCKQGQSSYTRTVTKSLIVQLDEQYSYRKVLIELHAHYLK